MPSSQEVVDNFVSNFALQVAAQQSLSVAVSNFGVLRLPSARYSASGFDWYDSVSQQPYDFVVMDLPLGMSRKQVDIGGTKLRVRQGWVELYKALQLISEAGYCLALVEPPAFGTGQSGERYLAALKEEGFSLVAIINTPRKLLQTTSLRPVIAVFQRANYDSAVVADLTDSSSTNKLANAIKERHFSSALSKGIELNPADFSGFQRLEAQQQLDKLKTQYKEYDSVNLGDIALEINAVRSGQQHKAKENSIYVPALATSDVIYDLAESTLKHQNLYQVVLSSNVLNQYVAAFFRSELGRLMLPAHRHGVVISRMPKSEVALLKVALPPMAEQRSIVASLALLNKLRQSVTQFQSEVAINPKNAAVIFAQVESMLAQIDALTDSDEVLSLSRKGESASSEFKQTFSVDIKSNKREKYIELSSLKTIVAFLNTDGGTLLVGVTDDGVIEGIDDEISKFFKAHDKFLLHFKNSIKTRIGEQFYPFINHRLVDVRGATVLMVQCKPAPSPCYLDGEDFYVRTNPATDKLQGPKLVQYVQNHFNNT